MKSVILPLLIAAGCLAYWSSSASAALRLRIEDVNLGKGVVITDDGAGDADVLFYGSAQEGMLMFSGPVGGFSVTVTTVLSKPIIGGNGNFAELDLNNVSIKSVTGAGKLRITAEDTDYPFTPQPDGLFNFGTTIGGTLTAPAGSKVEAWSWIDPTNSVMSLGPDALGAVGSGGVPLAAIGGLPASSILGLDRSGANAFGPGAYSDDVTVTFMKSGSYAMTAQVQVTFTGKGTVSFDENLIDHNPEPASLVAWGGLFGLSGWFLRRRLRSPTKAR